MVCEVECSTSFYNQNHIVEMEDVALNKVV